MNVNISQKELDELRDSQHKLNCLEQGGVDNWEWYGESLKGYFKEREFTGVFEDYLGQIIEEICIGGFEPSEKGAGFATSPEAEANAGKILGEFVCKIREHFNGGEDE